MADDGDSTATVGECLATTRSRRSKKDNSGRTAALERLRNLKGAGAKNKYEIADVQNVYDVVDEREYSKKVYERQKDSWIVDDGEGGASGYVEDGREIFDDDYYDPGEDRSRTRKSKSKKEKVAEKAENETHRANFQDIRSMLTSMPVKRKRPDAAASSSSSNAVDPDSMMNELMAELHNDKASSSAQIIKKIAAPQFDEIVPVAVPQPARPKFGKPELKKFKPCTSYNGSSSYDATTSPFSPSSSHISKAGTSNGNSNAKNSSDGHSSPARNFHDDDNGFEMDAFDDSMDADIALVDVEAEQSASTKDVPKVDLSAVTTEPIDKNEATSSSSSAVIGAKLTKSDNKGKASEKVTERLDLLDDISQYTGGDVSGVFEDPEMDSAAAAPSMEINDASGGKFLNFYWLDMFEESRNPGVVYLFGKVKTPPPNQGYSSCCIVVQNLTHCVFLLPRETRADGTTVKFIDVYEEFNKLSGKYNIKSFKSKKIEKNYCFDLEDVPIKAEYLEVRYEGKLSPLPQDLKGETFSRAFGTTTPLMETFLLEKKFKGPAWLKIYNYKQITTENQQSWCKFEFTSDVADVQIHPEGHTLPPPTLVLVSMNIQSINDAVSKKDSIAFAGVAVNKNFLLQSPLPPNGIYHDHFCLLTKPTGEIWPRDVERVVNKRTSKWDSERSMLGCLLAKLHQLDADVYVGHDLNFELLLLQLLQHKVPHWSRIGRLKRSSNPVTKGKKMLDQRAALAGRLVCDVKTSAMELIRARSYDLASLGSQILGMKEDQIGTLTGPEMKQLFDSSEGLRSFVNWGMQHCVLNIRLINELQVMPLAMQITTIAGNLLSRTLLGGRSERNEYLLLHAFYAKGYIVPDKYKFSKWKKEEGDEEDGESKKKKSGKSGGPSYSGGLVLAPKKGFYDNFIVLMDFNSLYPSIIQEYNVCFTTANDDDFDNGDDQARGVLPEEIRKLVESRREVKKLMKDSKVSEDLMRQYDIRQKALKLTANSMYGCLGFRNSRFYAKNLAAYITGKGREILEKSKESVEKMGYEVIYGDTDSLMINSNTQDIQTVYKIGHQIKGEINRTYKLLELEIDGIFRFLLLLKKKKYAAMVYIPKPNAEPEYVMELKGLDMVRRDWAPIGANTAKSILNEIMDKQPLDDKIYKVCKILNDVALQLREGNVSLKDLLITKQLAKHPEEYKEAQGLYHVQVALRMNKSGSLAKKFRNGDTVSYLFCTDGLPHHLSELGLKPEPVNDNGPSSMEVDGEGQPSSSTDSNGGTKSVKKEEKELTPDPQYYLAHQVHPVVSRICDPIPGLDPARIAEALGLDANSYKKRRVVNDSNDDTFLGAESEAEKYNNCEKFSFKCLNVKPNGDVCGEEIVFETAIIRTEHGVEFAVEKPCPGCNSSPFSINQIKNYLGLFMRKFIQKYYKNMYICEDPSCTNVERVVPLYLERGYPVCSCKQGLMCKDYTEAQLYKQLNYLAYLFDIPKQMEELSGGDKELLKMRLQRIKKEKNPLETFHEELRQFVVDKLRSSTYSDISLKSLFSNFSNMMIKRKAQRQAAANNLKA